MDLIISAASKLVDYLRAAVYNEVRYCFTYGKHTKNLKQEFDKLKDMREDVRASVDASTRNGGRIKISVERWLADVEKMIEEAEQKIDPESDTRRTWFARYKLTKKAFKKTLDVIDLQSRRKQTDDVAVLLPPLDIDFLPDSTMAGVTGRASTSMVSQEIVVHKKTVDEIISQQTGDVKEIVFQQEDAVKNIFHALQDDECDIIGIYGMGGSGKTTLAKEIGRMAKECGLFDEVVMAVVSQNPDIRRMQGEFGDFLGLTFGEETVKGRAGRLYQRLNTQKRTLVMLDDVWSSIDLRSTGIPSENKGCKILMTTRQRNLCRNMGFLKGQEIPVKLLSEEASLDLLKRNAKPMKDSWTTSHLFDVSKKVARECGGLPLAIVTVGSALRDKTVEEWKAALQQLKKSKPLNVYDEEKGVFSCLKLSYDYLKSEEAKQCFLLASLFPEDYNIKVEDIVRYGIGIGLFKDVDSVEEARTQTRWITRNLVDACLLMDSNKEDRLKMHDTVRDFAIFISTEQDYGFLVKSGIELMEWPNKETFEQYKIISLIRNRIKALPEGLICPNLEMLLLGENKGFDVIPDAFFKEMTRLRVLDLSKRNQYSRSSADASEQLNRLTFPSSMAALVDLHTLYLNYCKLGDISILGKLKRLEILSLYCSDIDTLPKEIGELTNLRLLDLSYCRKLKHIPANLLSRLTRLEELYMGDSFEQWRVADSENQKTGMACLSELTSLHHLTNLCIHAGNPESFPQDFHVPNLQRFEISIGDDYHSFFGYPRSRILYVLKIRRPLPKVVMDMIQTTEELELDNLRDELVKSIIDVDQGGLSSLKSLTVGNCEETVFMMDVPAHDAPALLSNLDTLHLERLYNMKGICRWSLPEGSLCKLKTLKVRKCDELDSMVTGLMLLRLLSLEEIEVDWCRKATHIFGHIGTAITGTETLLLSNLRKINLRFLPKLKAIWIGLNPDSPAISLNKLTKVEIFHARKLSYIFPACIAESLVLLQVVKLEGCLNLKSIVAKGTEGNQPVYFSALRAIEVKKCTSLKSLFSVAEARNLRHLETIDVGKSSNITELISHDDTGGGGGSESMILMPKLSKLQMEDLSNTSRLCAKSFTMDLPSLEDLVIEECPLMESNGVDLTELGLEDLPMLKRAQIGEQKFSGEAIKNLFFSSGKVSSSQKPVVGLRLYLEGKKCNRLAIHIQHLSSLPNTMESVSGEPSLCKPSQWRGSDDYEFCDQFLEPVRWKGFSNVCTSVVKHDPSWIDEEAGGVFVVSGAQLISKGKWPKNVLHLRLLYTHLPNCSIRKTEWAAAPQVSRKSNFLTNLSTTFTFTATYDTAPKQLPAVLNSGIYPDGPPVPVRSKKLLRYVDTAEVARGPYDNPGHWLVTAAKLITQGSKIGLHVKFALLDYSA